MTDVATPPAARESQPKAPPVVSERASANTRPGPDQAQASDPVQRPGSRHHRVHVLLGAAAVVILALIVVYATQWWTHGRFVQKTNDAYLRADQVTVAPKVGGYVEQVLVGDNQAVRAGDPLVKIDTANYDAVLSQEQASLQARQAAAGAAQQQVAEQEAAVAEARAQLDAARVDLAYAASDALRYKRLTAQGVETRQRGDEADHTRDAAAAVVRTRTAAVDAAERQIATLKAQIAQADAGVAAQAASLRTARINLGDTLLRASIAGRIGDKSVRVGQFVQPGQRLMSVVPVQDVYLVANFKETQIGRMKIGQVAEVRIDALPGQTLKAVVDSFAPGTGAQFALLPPENATGNFTKIVQRVPVRFRLQPPEAVRDHLLPGLSAAVSVDTLQAPEHRR